MNAKWSTRKPMIIGISALVVLIVGLGGWSALANISGAIVGSGQVIVEGNRQPVQHPQGGTVGEILVEDGARVAAGDILVRLDGTQIRAELAIVESQLFEIMARRARLEAERDGAAGLTFTPELDEIARARPAVRDLMLGQMRLFEARRVSFGQQKQRLGERIGQIRTQIGGVMRQRESQAEQLALIGQELADQQQLLEGGLTQASRVLALQREEARIEGAIGELEAQEGRLRGQITEIDIEVLGLDTSLREEAISELRDIEYRELELRERRLAQLDTLSKLDVRAPTAGTIYDRQVNTQGMVIRPADVILYIVPDGIPLVISTRIDAIHRDEVRVGQEAALRFSAFDQRTTPEIFGYVSRVSADAFTDDQTGYTYYRAEILPQEGEVDRLGGVTLVPGMPVESFINTGERTPLNYLTKPLADYFRKAFRET
ncbi:MAG: HlyD family type I secretion periplasmic adaptor subunit [Pseudomonadota bacterium]